MEKNFKTKQTIEKVAEMTKNLKKEFSLWMDIEDEKRNKKLFFFIQSPNEKLNKCVQKNLKEVSKSLEKGMYFAIKDYITETNKILEIVNTVLNISNLNLKSNIQNQLKEFMQK